ncbi:hypothetical protein L3Q82_012639, partial [Scortum barcoo]
PTLLRDKLSRMGVDPQLMDWISDYLTGRPQYVVGLKDIKSDTVVSSTGAPQGTSAGPSSLHPGTLLHGATLTTSTAQLNTSKTKELVIDFGRSRPSPRPVLLEGAEVEAVDSYRYLGLWLDNKLDWTTHTSHLYGKTQSRLYFL